MFIDESGIERTAASDGHPGVRAGKLWCCSITSTGRSSRPLTAPAALFFLPSGPALQVLGQ